MRREIISQPDENKSDTLVAYCSCTGNTGKIAEYLINMTHADSYVIEAEVPYTVEDLAYNNSSCRSNQEQGNKSARPAISKPLESIENYDVIYLGYPIWWSEEPRIIDTFLESYNFSDKIVIPLCTSGNSAIGNSSDNLKNLANSGNWFSGERLETDISENDIKSWISSLN